MAKYPKEMDAWKKRAAWLMQGFDSRSKRTTDSLKNLLGFLNGDTSQRTGPLVRWCLLPANNDGKTCCQDDSDSWNRLVSMLSSFLCKAYAVPLLHRMKHYAPAASYVKVSTNLHGILPRILEEMENASATSANRSVLSEVVDVLLAENGGVQTLPDVLNNEDFQTLLGDMLNENKDYAAQNGARRRLALAELLKDTFHESSIITDMLVSPMERGTNLFLRRTHLLYEMQYLSNADPKYQEHQRESMDKFLQVIRGDLGRELLGTFLGLLTSSLKDAISNGLTGGQSQLNLIFQMVICCVTDFYRRFVQEFMQPPYTLLALANADAQTFVSEWKRIHQKRAKCRFCVDIEFTAALLDAYPEDIDSFPADIEEVQELLQRIAVWSPITSDAVEILHGQMQWCLSRRGAMHVKSGHTGVEISLPSAAIKQHKWLSESVAAGTMPTKAVSSGMQRMSGNTSSNQHTCRAVNNAAWLQKLVLCAALRCFVLYCSSFTC